MSKPDDKKAGAKGQSSAAKPKWPALAALIAMVGAYLGLDLTGVLGGDGGGTAVAEAPAESSKKAQPPKVEDAPASKTPAKEPSAPPAKPKPEPKPSAPPVADAPTGVTSPAIVAQVRKAFEAGQGDFWITLDAEVERTLSDDTEGSRHQRFILRLADDLTVLVAHNIDLAPRVPLKAGDVVRLRGEYEWSHKGGVLHWTHHDPGGRPGGWIELAGKRYE